MALAIFVAAPCSYLPMEIFSMQHLLACRVSTTTAVETDLTPIPDGIFTIQNSHFLPPKDISLVWAMALSANIVRSRIVTPTLRAMTTPFIRPVEAAATPATLPGVADYRYMPLALKGMEEIQVMGIQTSGGAQSITALLGVSDAPLLPAPGGQVFTMRGTATTTLTAGAWSLIAVTWQDSLPVGRYAVVGLDVSSATALAGRLIFNESNWRPGVPGFVDTVRKTNPMFIKGGLGILGTFNSNVMPQIEMLATAADTAEEVYLDLIRIG